MPTMNRRRFLAAAAASAAIRSVPSVTAKLAERRILTLVYDKSLGMMRAVERVVIR